MYRSSVSTYRWTPASLPRFKLAGNSRKPPPMIGARRRSPANRPGEVLAQVAVLPVHLDHPVLLAVLHQVRRHYLELLHRPAMVLVLQLPMAALLSLVDCLRAGCRRSRKLHPTNHLFPYHHQLPSLLPPHSLRDEQHPLFPKPVNPRLRELRLRPQC